MFQAVNLTEVPAETNMGTCCSCGTELVPGVTRYALYLPFLGPDKGRGWGCLVCNIPSDGAFAIICGTCQSAGAPGMPEAYIPAIRWLVTGEDRRGRVDLDEFLEACDGAFKPFGHLLEMHPELTFQEGTGMSKS